MPLTGGFVQHIASRIGSPVGEHRALAIVRYLIDRGHLTKVGSYKGKRHGYRVTLYRARISRAAGPLLRSSVRSGAGVKWWKHPLFGFSTKPKGYSPRILDWAEPRSAP